MERQILYLVLMISLLMPLSAKDRKNDDIERMKKWQAFASPGSMHQKLAERAGKWKNRAKMWMKPGSPPVETRSSSETKMILGGRYLKMFYEGSVSNMPFKGISIAGYDNHKKKFFSIWIDTMGTGVLLSEGQYDATGKILTEIGEMDDVATGQKLKMKIVTTMLDRDSYKLEMYSHYPGRKPFKSMELISNRIK